MWRLGAPVWLKSETSSIASPMSSLFQTGSYELTINADAYKSVITKVERNF